MAAPKGHEKWGGRPKGVKNKSTAIINDLISKAVVSSAKTPLEIMLESMNYYYAIAVGEADEDGAPISKQEQRQARQAACLIAEKAAPYIHSRLASIEVKNEIETTSYVVHVPKPAITTEDWMADYVDPVAGVIEG